MNPVVALKEEEDESEGSSASVAAAEEAHEEHEATSPPPPIKSVKLPSNGFGVVCVVTSVVALLNATPNALHAVCVSAIFGALASSSVVFVAYKPPLNRCRCKQRGGLQRPRHFDKENEMLLKEMQRRRKSEENTKNSPSSSLHCPRCLKRTSRGVLWSFLASPVSCGAHCAAFASVSRALRSLGRKLKAAGGRPR